MFNKPFSVLMALAIPAFAATALLLSTSEVSAQKKKNNEPQSLSDAQLATSIQTLRQVKVTLEMADHDYGGHRADAVHLTKKAIHQLHLALNRGKEAKAAPKNPAKGGVKGNNEPQPLSDAQLVASIPVLQQTQTLLTNANHDYAGHRAQAVTDLGAAITQLQKALNYRAAKDAAK